MNKKELALIAADPFTAIEGSDKVFGHSASAGKFGFFPVSAILGKGYAGRRWNENHTTYTAEAVIGSVDYLRELPQKLGLGGYLVTDDHNRRKLDPTNHYKLATGGEAKLDGSMGQYQWGWNVPWYLAIWKEGNYLCKAASLNPIPGVPCWRIPPATVGIGHAGVMDRVNDILCSVINTSEQFRGGNGSALTSGNASAENLSMLGYPATAIGTSTFEAKAAKRGQGWGAGWYWIETAISVLMEIILGTTNIQQSFNANKDSNGLYQGGLGSGITGMPNWDTFNNYYPVVPYSAGVEFADGLGVYTYPIKKADGTTVYNAPIPVFFGLRNFYGNLWCGKNRIVAEKQADKSYRFFVAKSSLTSWDYSKTSEMLHVGDLAGVETAGWSYISKINYEGLAGMPAECDATSSTKYADGCYRDVATSGFRSPLGAGNASDGGYAGSVYFTGDDAPSNARANLSSPLCETSEDFDPVPRVYGN